MDTEPLDVNWLYIYKHNLKHIPGCGDPIGLEGSSYVDEKFPKAVLICSRSPFSSLPSPQHNPAHSFVIRVGWISFFSLNVLTSLIRITTLWIPGYNASSTTTSYLSVVSFFQVTLQASKVALWVSVPATRPNNWVSPQNPHSGSKKSNSCQLVSDVTCAHMYPYTHKHMLSLLTQTFWTNQVNNFQTHPPVPQIPFPLTVTLWHTHTSHQGMWHLHRQPPSLWCQPGMHSILILDTSPFPRFTSSLFSDSAVYPTRQCNSENYHKACTAHSSDLHSWRQWHWLSSNTLIS